MADRLDRSRYYAETYGISDARYLQDGKYYGPTGERVYLNGEAPEPEPEPEPEDDIDLDDVIASAKRQSMDIETVPPLTEPEIDRAADLPVEELKLLCAKHNVDYGKRRDVAVKNLREKYLA